MFFTGVKRGKGGGSMIFPENIQEFDSLMVGRRIQDVRLKKGIKSIDMAVQLDLSKDQYSRIECGKSICRTIILHKIAQYLEVSADYLLYGCDDNIFTSQIYSLIQGKTPKEIEKIIEVIRIIVSLRFSNFFKMFIDIGKGCRNLLFYRGFRHLSVVYCWS